MAKRRSVGSDVKVPPKAPMVLMKPKGSSNDHAVPTRRRKSMGHGKRGSCSERRDSDERRAKREQGKVKVTGAGRLVDMKIPCVVM